MNDSEAATVTVTVNAVNDAPVPIDGGTGSSAVGVIDITVLEDQASIPYDVLSRYIDLEGDTFFVKSANADYGTVEINSIGKLIYTSDLNFNGLDTVSYVVSDGELDSESAFINVEVKSVNDMPVIDSSVEQIGVLTEDHATITVNGMVIATDADIGDSLTYNVDDSAIITNTQTQTGTYGSISLNIRTGQWQYTIDNTLTTTQVLAQDTSAIDSFTVTVTDGEGSSTSQEINITITGTNDAPIANDDTESTDEDTLVNIDVLVNDTDIDRTSVEVNVVSVVSSFSMDDQLIQIKNMEAITKEQASIDEYGADYSGGSTETLIKYEVWIDASALSALNASATEILGYQFDMDFDASEVGAFDFSMIIGENFGFNATNPSNSTITFNTITGATAIASSTAIVDTNATNDGPPFFLGVEKLVGTFYVSPINASATSVSITIQDILVVTNEGNIEPEKYSYPVVDDTDTTQDTSTDGDDLTVTSATANNGTVSINTDGTLDYQGNQDFNGTDTITYTVDDGKGGTDTATVTVDIAAVNDAPVATNDTATTDEDILVSINVLDNDTDIEGDTLTVTQATAANGTVTINADGTLAYTGNKDFNGTDTIT